MAKDFNKIPPPPEEPKLDDRNSPPPEGCPKGGVVPNSAKSVQRHVVINSIPIPQYPIISLPYNPALKKRARNLSEVLFWMQVTKPVNKTDFFEYSFDG